MAEETIRITGSDNNKGTQSSNDSSSRVHTTATLPNTYPQQPNAGVHVIWTVISKGLYSDCIYCDTTLTNYGSDISLAANGVYSLYQTWTSLGGDVEIHWAIKLDNATAPPPQAGSWVQAKHHYDGHLSSMNVKSVSDILNPILNNIPFMQEIAKY